MKIVWLLCLLCLGGSLKAQVLSDSVSCRLSGQSGQRRGWEASPWRSYFFRDKANFGSCYRFAGKIRCREITGWQNSG